MALKNTETLTRRPLSLPGSTVLLLALVAGGTGCFRATGISRPTALAAEIPASGGERIKGNKALSGPGDYYLGNDVVEMAVDGALFGVRPGQAGAVAGGSILDMGHVGLDTSFHRVSMPGDMLERLTPVVNQDPDLQLVFDDIKPGTQELARLQMTGGVIDPTHKLGVALDGSDRVIGLKASHTISLEKNDRYFILTTTLTNTGTNSLPIRNIADHLAQRGGGGFRPVIPATHAQNGTLLTNWGVDFPGTDAAHPLNASVLAPMVGFMGAEPADETVDSHTSLGLLPLDADRFLVAADPQAALTEIRPRYAQRVVVGSLPVASLGAGQSITHTRRLYLVGGSSQGPSLPGMVNGLFNSMTGDRALRQGTPLGALILRTFGTAQPGGPLQTEIRVEKNTGGSTWELERVEWREPQENLSTALSDAEIGLLLPTGTYRVTLKNRLQSSTYSLLTNDFNKERPSLPTPVLVEQSKQFHIFEPLAPERAEVIGPDGNPTFYKLTQHVFGSRYADGTSPMFQPLKVTFQGLNGAPDPATQRHRSLGGSFDPLTKTKVLTGNNFGGYLFEGGNSSFGTSMKLGNLASGYFRPGSYRVYANRGPLSRLDVLDLEAFDGQSQINHEFTVFPTSFPTHWTVFDIPGPSQGTGGGMLPAEQLSSALAEGVSVLARAELDRHHDPARLREDFRFEFFGTNANQTELPAFGFDPFIVGARKSDLPGFGQATALFTPSPNEGRAGGARPSLGWNLADFLTQAEGSFNVVHRPRGPQGLFTLKGFDRTVAVGTGANAWWNGVGPLSQGKTHGAFDGLELIRAEGLDPANPTPWFEEFKAVRADWFALLKQQSPATFTKGLGLSSALYSVDNPVGHARTYLKLGGTITQEDQSKLLAALKAGAAVASTGPLLDVMANGAGPGATGTVAGGSVSLTINLYAPDWVPVDEVRVVVNGAVVQTLAPSSFTQSATDFRLRSTTVTLTLPTTKDAFLVVEAGVPLTTTGSYRSGTPWHKVMRGIYPLAVTNPVFLDLNGGGYSAPGL